MDRLRVLPLWSFLGLVLAPKHPELFASVASHAQALVEPPLSRTASI
jgi:hypothetical protein